MTSRDPPVDSLFSAHTSGIDLEPLKDPARAILILQLTEISVGDEDGVEDLAKCNLQLLVAIPLAISQPCSV